jgi:outer membrane protein OmpU
MGLQYVGGKAAVAGSAGYAAAKLANDNAVTTANTARATVNTAGSGATAAQILAADQADAAVAQTGALLALEAAPVAAADATTKIEKRMTVTMSGSVETTSGLTFGATMNLRANEGAAAVTTGARVHVATGGVEVGVGNINGAIEYMPGVYSASAGLTGLGWGGMATNTAAKGAFGWDAYSSSGNGAEGVEVMYSAGALSAHLSYSDTDLGSAGNRTAGYVAYTMGDWTVAAGMQDSSDNTEDKTVLTVGGKVGDFGVGIAYADNDGETKIALNGSATFGATTVSAYVANEESASDNPMGLGVSHDLGGASLKGGVAKTASGQTRADVGVSFSF